MAKRRHIEYYAAIKPGSDTNEVFAIKLVEGEPANLISQAAKAQEWIHTVAKSFVDGVKQIQDKFKPDKISEPVRDLARQQLGLIPNGVAQFLKPLAAHYEVLQGEIVKSVYTPFSGDVTAIVRRGEIRTFLRTLDGKSRLEAFRRAIANRDDEVVRSFLEHADLFALLGREFLEEGKRQWLLGKDPVLGVDFITTETNGGILGTQFEHLIDDLAAYAEEPAKALELKKSLPSGWAHTPTTAEKWMNNANMPSELPGVEIIPPARPRH